MTDQEDAATDLGLPTDSSSEAESDSSSEAAPPSQARCTESSDSDDNDEMPSLEDDDCGTIAPAARADMAPEEPETVLEDNETAPAPVPVPANDDGFGRRRVFSRRSVLQRHIGPAEGPRSRAVLVEEARRRRVRGQEPERYRFSRSGGMAPRAGRVGERARGIRNI